jgi:hypothetical protein
LIQAVTSTFVTSVGVLSMHSLGTAGIAAAYLAAQLAMGIAVLPGLTRLLRSRP